MHRDWVLEAALVSADCPDAPGSPRSAFLQGDRLAAVLGETSDGDMKAVSESGHLLNALPQVGPALSQTTVASPGGTRRPLQAAFSKCPRDAGAARALSYPEARSSRFRHPLLIATSSRSRESSEHTVGTQYMFAK